MKGIYCKDRIIPENQNKHERNPISFMTISSIEGLEIAYKEGIGAVIKGADFPSQYNFEKESVRLGLEPMEWDGRAVLIRRLYAPQ